MSQSSPEKILRDNLDALLRQSIEADQIWRQSKARADTNSRILIDLDEKCRRMRLALFALNGQYDKHASDANVENHDRRAQLKKATS